MVKSNLTEVKIAVSMFKVTEQEGKLVTFKDSNIAGMKEAIRVSNPLISNLSQLQRRVGRQAKKFEKLAETIEARDKADAKRLGRAVQNSALNKSIV